MRLTVHALDQHNIEFFYFPSIFARRDEQRAERRHLQRRRAARRRGLGCQRTRASDESNRRARQPASTRKRAQENERRRATTASSREGRSIAKAQQAARALHPRGTVLLWLYRAYKHENLSRKADKATGASALVLRRDSWEDGASSCRFSGSARASLNSAMRIARMRTPNSRFATRTSPQFTSCTTECDPVPSARESTGGRSRVRAGAPQTQGWRCTVKSARQRVHMPARTVYRNVHRVTFPSARARSEFFRVRYFRIWSTTRVGTYTGIPVPVAQEEEARVCRRARVTEILI